MIIIPAIDLYNKKCVRLHKGDYSKMTTYERSPIDQAKYFEDQGATHLHLVDLEAAQKGDLVHLNILETIKKQTKLLVDFGGGIRSVQKAIDCIEAGADQINIGTMAAKYPDSFQSIMGRLGPDKVILSADRDGEHLKINGWQKQASIGFWQFIAQFEAIGGKYLTSTDITKDGTLNGVNLKGYEDIWTRFPSLKVVISGGIGSEADIQSLFGCQAYGVIIGKAIYDNKIDLAAMINQSKIQTDDN